MKADTWGDKVTVVSGDMRNWQAPELADIVVSELLGSFGDNELSPECLDGAQRFIKGDINKSCLNLLKELCQKIVSFILKRGFYPPKCCNIFWKMYIHHEK